MRGRLFLGLGVNSTSAPREAVITVTTFRRLVSTWSSVVFATGIRAKVRAVIVFGRDDVCAPLDQLCVSMESMTDPIVNIDASSVSLKETVVDATAHAALSPSCRPLVSSGFRCCSGR